MSRGYFLGFIFVIVLFSSCSTKKSQTKSQVQGIAREARFYYDTTLYHSGNYVLAPSRKFVEDYTKSKDSANVLVLYPQILEKLGPEKSLVEYYDTVLAVNDEFLIPLPDGQPAHKGDFVVTWWQSGTGMQRAYIIEATDSLHPYARYVDFDWFGQDGYDTLVERLNRNTFRVITKPLDPGSSIAVKKGTLYNFYKVISSFKDSIVAVDWSGKLAYFRKDSVLPNAVHKQLEIGQQVWIPVFGVYTRGFVKNVDSGMADVVINFLGDAVVRRIPVLDVREKLP